MDNQIIHGIGRIITLNDMVFQLPVLLLVMIICICILMMSKGAGSMIDSVVELACRTGLPRLVVSATLVSMGTTTPEAFVSVTAAWMGNPGLALGNGVGSIIANTGFIFGAACLVSRIPIKRHLLNRNGWAQDAAAVLLVLISVIGAVTTSKEPVLHRWVGFLFLALLVFYMLKTYLWAREADLQEDDACPPDLQPLYRSLPKLFIGLVLVISGARVLVLCAVEIARRIGVPDDVIAATLVAFGTSLPEFVTAVVAIRKGHSDITVGNIVGANIFNCLFVIGSAAAVSPLTIPSNFILLHFPVLCLILLSFRLFVLFNRSGWFHPWQGGWLLGVYLFYVLFQYVGKFAVGF